jgi:hypothetical protein
VLNYLIGNIMEKTNRMADIVVAWKVLERLLKG